MTVFSRQLFLQETFSQMSDLVLTLIWLSGGVCGGGRQFYPLLFFFNNSKTVKDVTLVFSSIQQHFIRDNCAEFGIPNLPQSPDIRQNFDSGISDFWISGQSLVKEKLS